MSNAEKMVMVPRERLEDVLSVDVARTVSALDSFRAILDQSAKQHQGDAIGTLVRDYNERIVFTPIGDPHIIDDMKVYANADPGEVERLRYELAELQHLKEYVTQPLRDRCAERDTLRAQLAEAHALLREVLVGLWPSTPLAIKINAALSASAEPNAPVERDEQALIELALSEYGKATGKHVLPGGINENQDGFVHGFLVRATLER